MLVKLTRVIKFPNGKTEKEVLEECLDTNSILDVYTILNTGRYYNDTIYIVEIKKEQNNDKE